MTTTTIALKTWEMQVYSSEGPVGERFRITAANFNRAAEMLLDLPEGRIVGFNPLRIGANPDTPHRRLYPRRESGRAVRLPRDLWGARLMPRANQGVTVDLTKRPRQFRLDGQTARDLEAVQHWLAGQGLPATASDAVRYAARQTAERVQHEGKRS